MSLSDTSKLIEQSRKIVENSHDDVSTIINMILQIVTSIDSRMQRMETNIDKRLDELKQSFLAVSSRVRSLENQATEFSKKISDCETSCQGVSNLFDQINGQVKTNTRNSIHHENRIKKLEEKPTFQPIVQPVVQSDELQTLKEAVLDLKCRSMKNNLIFTGLHRVQNEDTEELLRCFLYNELGVDYKIEFGNVHRFKTRGDYRRSPIVARFLYRKDLDYVLSIANRLKGKPYGIREQFPPEIEQARKPLYPVMKLAKQQRKQVTLIRDRLYIDNELYVPDMDTANDSATNHHTNPKVSTSDDSPPYKRQRKGPSPHSLHTTGHSTPVR